MAMTFGIAFICLQEGCIAAFPFETDLFRKKWNEVKCECKKRASYTLTLNDIKWLKHIGKSKNLPHSPHIWSLAEPGPGLGCHSGCAYLDLAGTHVSLCTGSSVDQYWRWCLWRRRWILLVCWQCFGTGSSHI